MQLFNLNAKKLALPALGVLLDISLHAQEKAPKAAESNSLFTNGVFIVMFCVVVFLLIAIVAMAEFVKGAAAYRIQQKKKGDSNEGSLTKTAEASKPAETSKAVVTLLLLLLCGSLFAQTAGAAPEPQTAEVPFNYWGMGAMTFYVMMVVMAFEVLIFAMLYRSGSSLLADENRKPATVPKRRIVDSAIVRSMTGAVPVEQEESLLLDHDYDGIQELDNNLPPWWKYGFYLTIVVAVIYMLNYHVFKTGKSSLEEYEHELAVAEQEIAAYKKSNTGLIDENNVTRLTDATALRAGEAVFQANCAACHGALAEGKPSLGPNLTDDYWLHKGGTADIFKSIKYGWPENMMKAWEKELKAVEIQQVVSWIQSKRGSNPPNAKEPQGELYTEGGAAPADSTQQAPDVSEKAEAAPEI